VAFENGLLDLETMELRSLTPDWFSSICLPYRYDRTADCPTWKKVIHQNLGDDPERIALVQEMFGYCLIPTTRAHKFFVLVGEGGNGKSVVLAALEAVVGADNVSGVPFEMFGQQFMIHQTLGKLVNVCPEVGTMNRTCEGTLKAFVTGDRMMFERKGQDPFSARPTARLVIATNSLPRFTDKSDGIWRRLVPIRFNVRIPVDQQITGMDQPDYWKDQGELPGLLNWALEGLDRLRRNGWKFTVPAECREVLEEHRRDSNPARSFLMEMFVEDPNGVPIQTRTVYEGYKLWCQNNGHRPLSNTNFGKEVRRAFPSVDNHNHRFPDNKGGQQRAWFGLRLRKDSPKIPVPGPTNITTQNPDRGTKRT
jgi:P4 family phage/plasmid primase-like protien